ncbi:Uncharacterised protein [Legionella busanensis]|uniref:Uncharacterized protein n=1 Tax=Legionella busanensis TaxID=190655 RepID=A0A378JGR3_9GAMM|nr:hypothetical protein [Legionella busanensis]STX50187.1 Uncharacterised protein [Legionella busanensis]
MKKLSLIITVMFLFSPISFANDTKYVACDAIAKACRAANFKNKDKKFWQDCMKPLLLGKKVDGVSIEVTQVSACREKKIAELQQELKEFQEVK